MEKQMLKEKIKKIHEEIERYSYYYYSQNISLISDVEFDKLLKELEELELKYPELKILNSPTENVGSSLKSSKFKKTEHKHPMLSLSNSYNIGEVKDFINRIQKNIDIENYDLHYDLELKLDGASISLSYESGKLVKALTRGDGVVGEDVTENILAIETIPHFLKEKVSLEVRGEIVLPISRFKSLNIERLERGEEVFANPRNAASGTLRQIDSEIVRNRKLDGYFYFLVDAKSHGINSHKESIKYLDKLGLKTTGVCENISEIEKLEKRIAYWEKKKESLDFETDGMVIKVDNIDIWDELGNTSKSPRWAVAYKFPAKQVTTKLNDITWQVGRTGKITPVAELEEVELSGSLVKRASLHNFDEIQRKDIRIGDTVFVEKAAEIIPQVISSVKEVRTGCEKIVFPPINCPSCKSILIKDPGTIDLKCISSNCPEKIKGGIEYFVSRDGMNILGFGSKIVEKFIELGYLKNYSDIYLLKNHKEELMSLDKLGKKSIEKLLENIELSKENDYTKTLYSLGIPYMGKVLAKAVAETSLNIENLEKMDLDEIKNIEGVGEKVAYGIYNFFRDEKNLEVLNNLKEYGMNFKLKSKVKNIEESSSEFVGKTFLFTGKLSLFTRVEAQEFVESIGGINSNGMNKKLNYLIVGEDAGSKLEKAKKIETIQILNEKDFFEIISKNKNLK
ncbi:MAG: NAD-dependent DNA ligase LigA [Fusobacteriaceae bacterium]